MSGGKYFEKILIALGGLRFVENTDVIYGNYCRRSKQCNAYRAVNTLRFL